MQTDAELLNAVRTARGQLIAAGPSVARAQDDFEHVSIPVGDADVLRDLLIANGVRVVIEIGPRLWQLGPRHRGGARRSGDRSRVSRDR
jgi:hypothetical protein